MSHRQQTASRRSFPRWLAFLLVGLGLVAVAANVAWLMRRPKLAPLPAIDLSSLEPEVAEVIEIAIGNVQADVQSAMAWGDLGAVLRAHDLGPEANVCLANAERLNPGDYRWPYLLGVSLAPSDADAALACFRRAASLATDKPHVQLRLAETLASRGENAQAEAIVDRVLSSRPREPRALLIKARLLLEQGKLKECRSMASRSADAEPDKQATQLLLAQVCRRLKDKPGQEQAEAALASLPDGVTIWPDPDLEAVMSLRRDAAFAASNASQRGSGPISEVAGMLAGLAATDAEAAEAIPAVRRSLEQNQLAQAEAVLRRLLARHEDHEKLHYYVGVLCFQQRRFSDAAREFRRVVELKPDHEVAYYNLGHALSSAGDDAGARDAFAAAVRLNPGYVFARVQLAKLLLQSGETAEARVHAAVAIRLAPDDSDARQLWRQLEGGKD